MLAWLQRNGNSWAFLMSDKFSVIAWKLAEDILVVDFFVLVWFFISF